MEIFYLYAQYIEFFPIIKHSKTLGPRLIPTPGPIDLKKYSGTWAENILPFMTEKLHVNSIEIEGDIAFEKIDYAISRKLVVRF